MEKKKLIALVREMQEKKSVLVPLFAVAMFVQTCHCMGQTCYGGAFTNDMESQFFYV